MKAFFIFFAAAFFLSVSNRGQVPCNVDSRAETRTVSAYQEKYGAYGCDTNSNKLFLDADETLTITRSGGYNLEFSEESTWSYDSFTGELTYHNSGNYTVSGLGCQSDCSNSWEDEVAENPGCFASPCAGDVALWSSYWEDAWYYLLNPAGSPFVTLTGQINHCQIQGTKLKNNVHWLATNGWEEEFDSEITYSNEYDNGKLVENFGKRLEINMPYISAWGDSSGTAAFSPTGPSTNWSNASGTLAQLRFRVVGEVEKQYKARYQLATVFGTNTAPRFGPILEEPISGNGSTNYSRTITVLPDTGGESTTYVVYYGAYEDGGKELCAGGCPGLNVLPRNPLPGSGRADLSFGAPSFNASMGTGLLGKSAGEIHFGAYTRSNLANPKLLQFSDPNGYSMATYDLEGTLTRITSPQCVATVVATNEYKFSIDFYGPDQITTNGGLTGNPYVSWVFENPNPSPFLCTLNIYEVRGGTIITNEFIGDSAWSASLGNNATKKSFTSSFTFPNILTAMERTHVPGTNTIVQEISRKFKLENGRMLMVEEKNGSDAPLTIEYNGEGYPQDIVWPDGSWQVRGYLPDNEGMLDFVLDGWLTNSLSYISTQNRMTLFYYNSFHEGDDLSIQSRTPRAVEERLFFYNLTGRRYTMLRPNAREDRIVLDTYGDETATNNLIMVRTNYSSGPFSGHPLTIHHVNGTLDLFHYATSPTNHVITRLRGQPNPSGASTNIVNGTKTIKTYGEVGELVSELEYDLGSGILLSSQVCTNFDVFRRPLRYKYLDGTFEGFGYACCGLETKTNRDGTITYYTYDNLKRLASVMENGITLINTYDAADRLLSKVRQGTNATTMTLFSRGYNVEGRLIAETNALGSVTLFSEGYNAAGDLIRTNLSVETGGTYITRTARDGSLREISGTAANPVKYYYNAETSGDVAPDGPEEAITTVEVKLNSSGGTNEWTKTYQNLLGLPYKRVYAAASGSPTRQLYLNARGQIDKVKDPDGVQWLFSYDTRGRMEYEVLDLDRDGVIDWTGTDRITQVQRSVLNDAALGGNVLREEWFAWATNGANTSNKVWSVAANTAGLAAWSVIWNGGSGVTNKFEVSYPAAGTTRFRENFPNGARQVIESTGGRVVSVAETNSSGGQIWKATYGYDAHGRPQWVTDARSGVTTRTFNNADQVVSVTTPAPGFGQGPQTTTASYDGLGRMWRVLQPDGRYTTNEFTLRHELKKVTGALAYPVEYGYDAQGRLATLKTWQNYAAGTGTNITAWSYDAYRGFLTNKAYGASAGPGYSYTPAGRLATRTWARGITTAYTNDNAGRLYSILYSDGVTPGVTNTYDRLGRLATVAHNGVTTTRDYNGAGQLLREAYAGGVLHGLAVTNQYDSYFRRSSARVATYGSTLNSYTYDSANRLATVGDGTYSAAYSYLANSSLISQVLSKHSSSTRLTSVRTYDLLDRLTAIQSTPSATNTAPFYFGYKYNDLDQRTKVTGVDGSSWNYTYDWLGQLTNGVKRWLDDVPVEGEQFAYSYDDIGNRKSTGQGGDSLGQNLRAASYTNNALNQITGRGVPGKVDVIGVAAAGNVTVNSSAADHRHGPFYREELTVSNGSGPAYTSVTVSSSGGGSQTGNILTPPAGQTFAYDADGNLTNDLVWRYIWDGENRLTEIQPLTNNPAASKRWLKFAYDWRNRRIQKTANTWTNSAWFTTVSNRFLYSGWNLLGELNATNNNLIRGYIWGADLSGSVQGAGGVGGLVAINDTAEGTHFAAYDDSGNVVGLVKGSDGSVTAQYEYDPFGQLIRATGSYAQKNPFRFSTKYQDDETGLSYYGYRYYNSSMGRWLNRDPIAERGGVNVYGFCYNDAQGFADTDGREPFGTVAATASSAITGSGGAASLSIGAAAALGSAVIVTAGIASALVGADAVLLGQIAGLNADNTTLEMMAAQQQKKLAEKQQIRNSFPNKKYHHILEDGEWEDHFGNLFDADGNWIKDKFGNDCRKKKFKGGPHNRTKKPTRDGLDSHHIPADDASDLPREIGPAIQMDPEDHKLMPSTGSSKEAEEWRAKQAELIRAGKFREAQKMDIDAIRALFGNKYDKAIDEMLDYTGSIGK